MVLVLTPVLNSLEEDWEDDDNILGIELKRRMSNIQ